MEQINEAAIAKFMAGTKGATPEQIKTVVARMRSMVARRECPFIGGEKINLATVEETCRRLEALI